MFTIRPEVDKALSLNALHRIPLQRPDEAGSYWQGIRHGAFVDSLIGACKARSWEVTESRFTVNRNGNELIGVLDLTIPRLAPPPGQTYSLGFITSNDRKRALKISVGTNVFVCSNGLVTGQIVLRRKHTLGLDLERDLVPGLDAFVTKAKEVKTLVSQLRHRTLTTQTVDKLLMAAGREELMPWSRIGEVDHEYRNPRFSEHGKNTSWALLQAFTWVVKKNPPAMQMDQIDKFRAMLPLAI